LFIDPPYLHRVAVRGNCVVCVAGPLIVEYLKELANRADLGATWDSWSTQYHVLAVIVGLLAAYLALRSVVPAILRLLRPALLLVIVLLGVWALFPGETCSIELLSRLPLLCRR
jgi:hypothetical protein